MANNDITFTRPEHIAACPLWETERDVCRGPVAVKSRGHKYLPKFEPDNTTAKNTQRNADYLMRAVFYAITGQTKIGLLGLAYRRSPALAIPDRLDYLKTNAEGAGTSIYQQSQETLENILEVGRHGLYVDYNETDKQSVILAYRAEEIINWRTERINGKNKLVLVVLRECVEKADGFGFKDEIQYRELALENGKFVARVWRKASDAAGAYVAGDTYMPVPFGKDSWDEIPFTFIGAQNNDPEIDDSPLGALVEINLGHYRNSADYEDSVFFCGQIQPWISGLSKEWRDYLEKKGIAFGSRSPLMLPMDGKAGFIQGQPNMIAKEAMDDKKAYMIALGARLLEQNGAVKTATEASGDQASATSVLGICCSNVSEAYTQALKWGARYLGQSEENINYEISQEFIAKLVDAQIITAIVSAWMNKALPKEDMIRALQKMDIIDPAKDVNDVIDALSVEGPTFVEGA